MKRNPLGRPGVELAPGGVPPKPLYPLIIRRERPWPDQCARVFSCATPRRAWSAGGRIGFTAGSQQDSGSGFLLASITWSAPARSAGGAAFYFCNHSKILDGLGG